MAEAAAQEAGQEQKASPIKKMLVPALASLVVLGVALGALNFFGIISFGEQAPPAEVVEEAEGEETPSPESAGSPAYFFSFYPDMLVNFTADGRAHFLKVKIDDMSRDEDAIKGVEEYHSIMRNNLLMLFQQVKFETVNSQQGISEMQALALAEIKRVLKQYHGENDVEGVYFTSFVVQ